MYTKPPFPILTRVVSIFSGVFVDMWSPHPESNRKPPTYKDDALPVELYGRNVEEGVGFEPTDPFGPAVFRTAAINRTLPAFHVGARYVAT